LGRHNSLDKKDWSAKIYPVKPIAMAKAKKAPSKIDVVEKVAGELLSLMGVTVKPKVFEDKENEAIVVSLETQDEAGLLIGRHGQTIESLQTAIGMLTKEKLGEWTRVVVNVGDWR
jgi:predicted RNA-binding protein Jag